MKKSTKAWSMKMRLALLALASLAWIAVPVSARAEGDSWVECAATSFAGVRVRKMIPIRSARRRNLRIWHRK